MFVARVDRAEPNALHGWLQDGLLDLFVWFEDGEFVQAQVTVDRDVAEWRAPSRLNTGLSRDPPSAFSAGTRGSVIDFDRQVKPERVDAIRAGVSASTLPDAAKELINSLLTRNPLPEAVASVRELIRAASPAAPK